ncbi:rhomboid family intramembrane serine protease [Allomuricauda sp. SCSIO 65647]|uniref:rhomboid family intramembrane serine protease n=1 Tax=Allomuricauda sp. SCSIO 65647 TaxID=2908843 RepID=UPI001F215A05|nr:rhomboid family intramembrane serine protease [Muricauda sp. SCSIO 65647]UJH67892.1 rhomboid family intramembrane serine protease [Muricauda sp. SCSIO 65647]
MATGGIRYHYSRLNIAEKLIVLNVLVFILDGLSLALMGKSTVSWFQLPKEFFDFLAKPWALVTYSFFHGGFWHLFWNMLMLYFTGRIFLNLFDAKRFLTVYFLGVLVGGSVFLLSYNIFPTLIDQNTALIGASAGVTAVLIFICAYIPNQEVRIIFFNVKLWYVGVFFVLIDLLQIPYGGNIGGRLAHLGGALLGYLYARQLLNGNDIGEGFSKLLDSIGNLFRPREKRAPMKTVYKKSGTGKRGSKTVDYDKEAKQRKIDAILDKISKSGYESLSQAEKDFLFKAGKED